MKADRAPERAYQAQERVAQQRLNLVDTFQKCVRDAGSDQSKAVACESYLKGSRGLRGRGL